MFEIQPALYPLSGDCNKLPDHPTLKGVDKNVRLAAEQIGSISKQKGRWVGVSIPAIGVRLNQVGRAALGMHPAVWASLDFNHPLIMDLTGAERQGFITICDGYIHPTQKLVDALMKTVR